MKKKFLTAYQTVMSVLLVLIWTGLFIDGKLQTFDRVQWGAVIYLSLVGMFAIGIIQWTKNQEEKELYELNSSHEDAVDYEYEEDVPHINEDGGDYFYRLPEYALASTSLQLEETYVFSATENGEVINWSEIDGIARRWGNENWKDADAAIASLNTLEHMYVFVKDMSTKDDASLKHRLYRRIDKADAELSSFEAEYL